jgi:hypothetical protein
MGEVPGFEHAGAGAVRVLSGPRTPERLGRLSEVLSGGLASAAAPADVAAAVRAQTPEFASIADRLLVPRTSEAFYALLTLIVTVIWRSWANAAEGSARMTSSA